MCIELDATYRSDNIKSPVKNSDHNINNKIHPITFSCLCFR